MVTFGVTKKSTCAGQTVATMLWCNKSKNAKRCFARNELTNDRVTLKFSQLQPLPPPLPSLSNCFFCCWLVYSLDLATGRLASENQAAAFYPSVTNARAQSPFPPSLPHSKTLSQRAFISPIHTNFHTLHSLRKSLQPQSSYANRTTIITQQSHIIVVFVRLNEMPMASSWFDWHWSE